MAAMTTSALGMSVGPEAPTINQTNNPALQQPRRVQVQEPTVGSPDFQFKYDELQTLNASLDYIKATYGQHYANDKQSAQVLDDFMQDPMECLAFCKLNAVKYLKRYGKKNGHNPVDLMKAMHYTVLMQHCANVLGLK
jgi:hypothetical protein